jgi:hypothetical protein
MRIARFPLPSLIQIIVPLAAIISASISHSSVGGFPTQIRTVVASAARKLGLLDAKTANAKMPGGLAAARLDERNRSLERLMLFGEARQAYPPV